MRPCVLTAAALSASLSVAACAQTDAVDAAAPPSPPAPPPAACTTDAAPYRDFDFWAGSWDVYDPEGNYAGENTITKRENGCLLVEDWAGAQGGTGLSMNFYDPAAHAWRQVWQSAGAFIDYTGGLDENGAMALEGSITYHRNGESFPFRGRWTRQDDGSVLQEFWQYDADADNWDVWFVGEYRPKTDDGDGD